ncbi:hypothetical protein MTY81_23700 [Mycolicibacterium sp. TY81]|nr:hypothetical protein MTY81_23700 [Mycolicibacterium sp. TY81]
MTTHSTVVSTGHGDTSISSGAKKKPVPTYQADPVRSAAMTARSQTGGAGAAGSVAEWVVRISIASYCVVGQFETVPVR